MKNTKRWLILFFTFAFFFGSVAIGLSTGNIGADLPEADYFSSQAVTGDITFYVPETIYLTPVDGSMSTFQYYVDCNTSGTLDTSNAKTSGVVYFKCAGASSVSISASGATVTLGTSSASGETLSTTVTGGTLSAGISEGNVSTITWTATYYLNGVARTAKAYSVAYAPNIEPVASAIRTWNNDGVSDGIKAYLQAFTYATGVHTIASGGYGANRSGGKVCAPMLGTITTPGNNGVTDWFNTSASKKGTNYTNKEGGGDNIVVIRNSPTATLTVDTSRYTNISQIPNFRYGLVITDTDRMSGEGYWFVSDYTDGTYKSDGDESKDGGNINAWWGTDGSAGSAGIIKDGSYNGNVGVGNGIKVGGQTGKQMFSKGISGTGAESLVIKGAAKMQNGSEWNATINLVNVSFNKVNKGTLRNNIRTYINKGLQSDDYSGDFAAYEAEIKAAAEKLGNPTNSDTSDTIASKFGALTRKTYNSTLTHKFDGRKADVTEGPTAFNSGDNITIGPNSYTGYTINSASGATTSTSNTTLYIRRSAISQTYNYVANSYTLTFDANGGSVTPGSKTVKYDFTYNYGGNLPVPTRTGYNFDGWYTAASGGTKVNDSDYVETAGNHTVYAHWTAQTYTVTFADPIGGGTPSPASKTVTYDQAYGALATISRTGYDFDGWYTAQTGGTKVEATTTVTTASNHTLYARWTAKTYTVTYDANGGSVSPGSKSVTYDSAYGTLATPTRTGYSFNGWYTAASGGSEVTASTTVTTASNHTIYAQWSINQYTITFDSAGGSAVSPITQDYGTAVTPPANPTRTGYTFNGWSPAVPSTMPAGNMTCTAQWTINQYTVTFNSNGGSAVSSVTQNYNTQVSAPTAPTKTGHTFAGWYTDAGLTTPVSWPHTLTANVTFYAKWTVNYYNLTFDAAGGTGGTGPTSTAYGVAISAPIVTRTGYTFAGWNPTVPATMPANDSTYTAQWTANTYYVIFDKNGGSGSMSNQGITYGQSANLTENDFTPPTGHSFAGWNTAADGTGTSYADKASYGPMGAANVTLYAQWTIKQFTITFNSNGGTSVNYIEDDYNEQVEAPTPPTKYGYNFAGWYTDEALENPVSWPHTLTANVTFYAKWAADAPYVPSGEVSVKVVGGKFVVDVKNPAEGEQYQIWTYQEIISDELLNIDEDVPANQWLLAKAYSVSGTEIPGGGVRFELMNFEDFHSPTENYLVAVRIADGSGNFLREVRDAYTPENLGVPVITKVLVDGEVTTGYELREIKGNTTTIEVIGNDVEDITYSAKVTAGKTATVIDADNEDDNKFIWTLSNSLEPGIYIVEVKAEAGGVEKTYEIKYELYKTSDTTDYGYIDNLNFSYSNGSLDFNMLYGTISERNDYGNGSFSYRLREPGRKPFYRSVEFTENDTVTSYSINKPGIYEVDGYVTREGYIGTEANGAYDDGIIRNFVIPRDGVTPGSVTLTLEADKDLPDLQKGVKVTFTALATGLPGPIEYSFWRYDAAGYVLVKDWSQSGELQWTPARVGTYNLQVRAKGAGAGSYEIARSIEVNVLDNQDEKADITSITLNDTYIEENAQPRKPILLRADATATNGNDLLYKFYVYDKDLRTQQLKGYSIDQTCVWKPRKPGVYTISVLVKNQASFGKYDAIESFEITVS